VSNSIHTHPDYPYVQSAVLCELRDRINDMQGHFFLEEDYVNMFDAFFPMNIRPGILAEVLHDLVSKGVFEEIRDDRAGSFFRLSRDELLNRYNDETSDPSSLTSKYKLIGQQFLASALQLSVQTDEGGDELETKSFDIPAAGRLVEISHNQSSAIDNPTLEIINALEADNGLPEEPGFRERILGQIKAGRELIRAGIFDAQLFYLSMIVGLKMLIEKYKEHAIGAAASKLIDIIYENIGSSLT